MANLGEIEMLPVTAKVEEEHEEEDEIQFLSESSPTKGFKGLGQMCDGEDETHHQPDMEIANEVIVSTTEFEENSRGKSSPYLLQISEGEEEGEVATTADQRISSETQLIEQESNPISKEKTVNNETFVFDKEEKEAQINWGTAATVGEEDDDEEDDDEDALYICNADDDIDEEYKRSSTSTVTDTAATTSLNKSSSQDSSSAVESEMMEYNLEYNQNAPQVNSNISNNSSNAVGMRKCHNLSISELKKKLSFCPICQIQYSSHKSANMCLSRHGKRQCWLCLEVLSAKKEDFCKHSVEHHSVSNTGDIVGCPYCGKCFDFRQGLNQHIVKIHFSESIPDLDAVVSSLSPTTLVDIFTGKPRTSFTNKSSSPENVALSSQSTFKQVNYDVVGSDDPNNEPILALDTPNDTFFPHLEGSTNNSSSNSKELLLLTPSASSGKNSSLISLLQSERSMNDGMVTTISSGFVRSRETSPDLNKESNNDTSSFDTFARPSVITSGVVPVPIRKTLVPPEQLLSTFSKEIGFKSPPPLPLQNSMLDSISSFDISSQSQQQQQQKSTFPPPPSNQTLYCSPPENNLEMLENTRFKFHRELSSSSSSSLNYNFSQNLTNPSSRQMMMLSKVTSDPEKCELSSPYSEIHAKKFHEGSGDPIPLSMSTIPPLMSISSAPYEQAIITRVNPTHFERGHNDGYQHQEEENSFHPSTSSSLRSSGANCSSTLITSASTTGGNEIIMVDPTYSSSFADPVKGSSSAVVNIDSSMSSRDSELLSGFENITPPSPSESFSAAGNFNILNNAEMSCSGVSNGSYFNPEIERNYNNSRFEAISASLPVSSSSPKFPDNCGVKRRILMKAMWDEQNQFKFKKPALMSQTHSANNNNETPQHNIIMGQHHNSMNTIVQSFQASPSTPFHRSVISEDDSFAMGRESEKVQQHQRQQELQPSSIYVSQGEMIKHAGTFFEQYLQQDRTRTGDPYKLLDLVRPAEPLVLSNMRQHEENKNLGLALGWSNGSNYSCARSNPASRTWSGGEGTNSNRTSNNDGSIMPPPPPPPPRTQHFSQWQAPGPTAGTFSRSQFPTPTPSHHQMYVRKASNPAFWDNLRARLLAQSSNKYFSKSGEGNNETFTRHLTNPTRPFFEENLVKMSKVKENVVVKNPFEEEEIIRLALAKAATDNLISTTASSSLDLKRCNDKPSRIQLQNSNNKEKLEDKTCFQTRQLQQHPEHIPPFSKGSSSNSSNIDSFSSGGGNYGFEPNLIMPGHPPQVSCAMPIPPPLPAIQLPTPSSLAQSPRLNIIPAPPPLFRHNGKLINEHNNSHFFNPMRYFNSQFYNKYTEGYAQLLHRLHKLEKSKNCK